MYKTYSFEDVTVSCNHPSVGAITSTGAGIGTISVAMSGERTVHDVAADGTVMITKVIAKNGIVSITLQQTSEFHKWLLRYYNYIDTARASEWASMNVTIKSNNLGDETICTGVSPQKLADRPYQSQGQHVTWPLMAAEITES
jgi:hypothetical protein